MTTNFRLGKNLPSGSDPTAPGARRDGVDDAAKLRARQENPALTGGKPLTIWQEIVA